MIISYKHNISKSSFIRGLQCLKSLYLKKYYPELEDKISESQQAVFTKGTDVGILAQQLFPGGIDLGKYIPLDFEKVFSETTRLINEGQEVIYEAGFRWNNTICFVDILVKKNGKWYAYEVKGSTSIHDIYLWDTAFQYHVITSLGLALEDFSVIHLNNQYIRRGELNLHELFTVESVLKSILHFQDQVKERIIEMNHILSTDYIPDMDIGPSCNSPYTCSFEAHCWSKIPKYSIFNISRLSSIKKFELYRNGILTIKDIPDDYPLSSSQQLQVDAEKNGRHIINVLQIQKFLQQFKFPLYFLDFETFQPAVPMFDLSRAYQQIPFQYSLHILDEENEHLFHKEFLAAVNGDPRIPFIEKLINDVGDKGDIIVYNKAFEITRLKEIARDFPEYKENIAFIINRIVDLMVPFSRKHFYTPEMKGSYSIKSVLPALVSEISYETLDINRGDLASHAFERLYSETDESVIEKTRQNLLEYCKLDTLAMVEILKVLQRV